MFANTCCFRNVKISKEDGVWTNCTSGENCTVDAVALQSPALRTGFITFTSLVPHTNYSFSLRGCNEHGCGEGDTFETRTRLSGKNTRASDVTIQLALLCFQKFRCIFLGHSINYCYHDKCCTLQYEER